MAEYKKIIPYFLVFIGVIIVIVLVAGSFVIKNFKESEAYTAAVNHAYSNPEIQSETGGITGIGYLVGGELTQSSAELNFKVYGVKKNLNLYFELSKSSEGSWVIDEFSY
jgi:hypothetical protein